MPLVVADGPLREQILDLTYPIWNEGLTRRAYGQWNDAQMRTPWGQVHLARVALLDEAGAPLASAKRYRFRARFDGQTVDILGIGAVFTPQPLRGRGHASRLIELLVDEGRTDGAALAMLFSEIDPAFYERLGFRRVPIDQLRVVVNEKGGGTPAMLVRGGHQTDLQALSVMHDTRITQVRFALERPPAHIEFMLARKRLLAGLGPPGLRHVEFHVVEEGASAVAYVMLSVDAHGWTLTEAGDRDPSGARLGAMLQTLIAREPSQQRPAIRTWWPRCIPLPPQWQRVDSHAADDVLMMRPLRDIALPAYADEVLYWRSDFF
jgi:GNAT superfamily N-acetyltransferase